MFTFVILLLLKLALGDPRYFFDPRCPAEAVADPVGTTRTCSSCVYSVVDLPQNATIDDCATACCGDWSCLSFVFTPPSSPVTWSLNGSWTNFDSLRGESGLTIEQDGIVLSAQSNDPAKAYWSSATGAMTSATKLWLCFDCGGGDTKNNRTGTLFDNNSTIAFDRLPFDPVNFTQVGMKRMGSRMLGFRTCHNHSFWLLCVSIPTSNVE